MSFREGGNPVLANRISLGPGLMIAGMTWAEFSLNDSGDDVKD
jgi:hypothetical protein